MDASSHYFHSFFLKETIAQRTPGTLEVFAFAAAASIIGLLEVGYAQNYGTMLPG